MVSEELLTQHNLTESEYRKIVEILKRSLDAVGVRVVFRIGQWQEQLKATRAGKLQMWSYGLSATAPELPFPAACSKFELAASGSCSWANFIAGKALRPY